MTLPTYRHVLAFVVGFVLGWALADWTAPA